MSFGKFKKVKAIPIKNVPFVVGLPNPQSVSKEEFERRVKRINEKNKALKAKYGL